MIDLDALEALCDAATPGPWHSENDPGARCEECDDMVACEAALVASPSSGGVAVVLFDDRDEANAAFIAQARTAVPALIARVRELEAERTRWENTVETCDQCLALQKARERIAELEAQVVGICVAERAAVVAWLTSQAESRAMFRSCAALAEEVGRGEHCK